MIRWCDNGHPATRVQSGRRCTACDQRRERNRATPAQRGYGAEHQAARRALAASMPAACGYERTDARCPRTLIHANHAWVAAHVVDGDPAQGWMHAHPACNERAKVAHATGGGRSGSGERGDAIPAPRSLASRTGLDASRARPRDGAA